MPRDANRYTPQEPFSSETEDPSFSIDAFRTRFIVHCTWIGVVLCLLLMPVDWLVRGSLESVAWSVYFAVGMALNGLGYWRWRRNSLWAALTASLFLLHLALVDPEMALVGYIWAYIYPVPILFVSGLRRGAVLAAAYVVSFWLVLSLRPWPLESDLRWDLALSLMGVVILGVLYEHVRIRHADALHIAMSTDGLTGLANRRRFDEALVQELDRAARYDRPLTLVIFDVDDFKSINDVHGHPTGDRILKTIARLVAASVRTSDLAARMGGDEFAIVAPETQADAGGRILAERLRQLVAEHDFGLDRPIGISVGVSGFHQDDSLSTLYTRADVALYRSKQAGRNTVHVIDGEQAEEPRDQDLG